MDKRMKFSAEVNFTIINKLTILVILTEIALVSMRWLFPLFKQTPDMTIRHSAPG